MKNCSKDFFVIYSLSDSDKVSDIVFNITQMLDIRYDFVSHRKSDSEEDFIDNFVTPNIEASRFVIFCLSKNAKQDKLVNQQFLVASNLNKTIVPIIIESDKISVLQLKTASGYSFRSNLYVYDDEDDHIAFLEQLHSLLGLSSAGDPIGNWVTISSDCSATVYRRKDILGTISSSNQLRLKLKKGTHNLLFRIDDEAWLDYEVVISSNEGKELFYAVDASSAIDLVMDMGGYPVSNGTIDTSVDLVSNKPGWSLYASSVDYFKRASIVNYFVHHYNGATKPLPKRPNSYAIELPKWLDSLIYTGAGLLCFVPLWAFLCWLFWFILWVVAGICTLTITFFYWDPISSEWANVCDKFSWTLLWASIIVGGYWGLKLFLKGSYATYKEGKYQASVMSVNIYNSNVANTFNEKMNDALTKHHFQVTDVSRQDIIVLSKHNKNK